MVLLLALVYQNPIRQLLSKSFPHTRLCQAAISFMVKSSHADGTCDDYFPYERAMGALVFSLYGNRELLDPKDE